MFINLDTRSVRDLADEELSLTLALADAIDPETLAGRLCPGETVTDEEIHAARSTFLYGALVNWMDDWDGLSTPELARAVNDSVISAKALDGRAVGRLYAGVWLP